MYLIKIKALQELYDEITKQELDAIKKIETPEEQKGFLNGILFAKHLIIQQEINTLKTESKDYETNI